MTTHATILAIETATSSCSAALSYQGRVYLRHEVGNNVHSKVLLDMVQSNLVEAGIEAADIDAVAVGQGPGSFTGLRIGVGVAQGVAYGVNAPMIGLSSLDALANQAPENGRIIAGIDARMGEIYWCEYIKNDDGLQRVKQSDQASDLRISAPSDIKSESKETIQLFGNAWAEYEGQFAEQLMQNSTIDDSQIYPMADSLLVLAQQAYAQGELISAIDFAPEYVRNDVAKKSTKPLIR